MTFKLLGELFLQCWPILAVLAVAGVVRFACIERRRRAKINRSWRKEQTLREREGQ